MFERSEYLLLFIFQFSVFSFQSRTPEVPPLGECPKDKGGAASGEEKAFCFQRHITVTEKKARAL